MMTRASLIAFCKTLSGVFEDYPFHDPNWTVMRHTDGRKTFAFIYEANGRVCLNLKCMPELAVLLRGAYRDVIPGYHMNKEHWNTVITGGDVPDAEVEKLIALSYDLTTPPKGRK
ncbi:MAG: MmcQ/YjbR family DNA-binding protein [Clostridiaceae bacterium]|jgi:predicted DNA-binding protein (MmcQ/YjbR family)|nr:MmcQ/YjbR family DNA-binding protein [Clostridiaceae bacterium]